MARVEPKLNRRPEADLVIEGNVWLNLGDLRGLVAKADELGWSDRSLIGHSFGSEHISRRDIQAAKRIVIEGGS